MFVRGRVVAATVAFAVASILISSDAAAQSQEKVARIGYVTLNRDLLDSLPPYKALLAGLRDLGYVEGRNLTMEIRFLGDRPERRAEFVSELVQLPVDVLLVPVCGAPLEEARQATKTIPIVVPTCNDDLVETGVVRSLSHPGGNITGLSKMTPELAPKRLQLLKQVVPGATRVAVLWNPAYSDFKADWRELRGAAQALGVTLLPFEFRSVGEFESAFAAIARERPDAMIMFSDLVAYSFAGRVAALARANRIPGIFPFREVTDAGGLMSYGPNIPGMWRQSARYFDLIIKGAKPGDLPIQQPTRLELIVNRKAAADLGLGLSPPLLLQADQIVD